ncbi:polyprenyl synthetase family protein [Nocardia sp. CDC160]|uniref:polyprenyl synthetase family protein n=1 Tax=Nocardia sp. CDC160 TaxID=3112166 RepID=UPI002DBB298A|nr:polyprenyl synthetase family protein [Nocardia sp. CDC160]MEC3919094.1 polyprenyl synthetase family protein [Nocardia sp. CDC160]
MSTPTIDVTPMDRTAIRVRVEAALYEFLGHKAESAAAAGLPADVVDAVRSFLFAGGKRIRPLFCVLGWYAGGGAELPDPVVRVAAAVELFHAAVLIHDDIIDDSDTRRDRPTVHRAVADRKRTLHDRCAAARFGTHAALLIGDFGLVWSQELLHTAGLTPTQNAAAAPILDAMRTEVNYGQYLDLLTTGRPTRDLDQALEIIRYKTAAYTVQRPLQLGAALAGAGPEVLAALSGYGVPLGEAFQLQDDLLGVFGDPTRTGKSTLDDLREGKHTVLLALALRDADPEHRAQLDTLVGNPRLDARGAARCREILSATARPEVERMIRDRWLQVQRTLARAPFPPDAVAGLRSIADAVIARTS